MCLYYIKKAIRITAKTVSFLVPAYILAYLNNALIPVSLFALLYSFGFAFAATTELEQPK